MRVSLPNSSKTAILLPSHFLSPHTISLSFFFLQRGRKNRNNRRNQENEMQEHVMIIRFRVILFVVIGIFFHVAPAAGDDDGTVMCALAKSLIPTPMGWTGSNYCKWPGVSCKSGSVTSISYSSKSVAGELPPNLNQLSKLETLNFQNNNLSGAIPPLSEMNSLQQLFLDNNNFSSIPPFFPSGLKSLQTFSISENPSLPPWSVPNSLTESSSLVTVYATRCGLTGTLPDIFGSFPNLQSIRLSYNNLTGPLPPSLSRSGIQNLWLNNQGMGLSGTLDVLGSMLQLNVAWLHDNQFSGPIPDISDCTFLSDLQLRDNQLTGVVPASLSSLPKLANVSLQNNKLQGPVPDFPKEVQASLGINTNSFCNLIAGPCDSQVSVLLEVAGALSYPMALAEDWKGNNPCGNWNYITCNDKGSVTVINLANQNWTGTISPAMANFTELKSLLLNDNRLTGPIPASLASLAQLQELDVSNNNLSGKVPNFPSHVEFKSSGNPFIGLDLPPISPPGRGGGSSSSGGSGGGSSSGGATGASSSRQWVIAGSIIAALIVIAFLSFFIYKCYVMKDGENYVWGKGEKANGKGAGGKGNRYGGSDLPSQSSGENSDIQFYDGGSVAIPIEVLREVTNNFSEGSIIGRGGFGVVYRGKLHDGTEIAVKRMESSMASSKGLYEFKAEIEVLTKVRHRHLVALHGFCVNGNERLLVYEYMLKGTLGQHLFEYNDMGVSPLTWKQRVTIALDVARGVEYLHSLAQQSFIHRDLKPSNILLGDDMRAKVSDFGLVKSAPNGGKCSMETRLAGTFGYLAPEYAATGRVTTKVDVFAFGIVLMELITGRKALDESLPDDQSHLVTWFRKALANRDIRSYIDPCLNPDQENLDSIYKVVELAGHCTARDLSNRPDMGHVVNVLSPLVEQWKPTSSKEEASFGIDLHMSLPQVLQRWKDNEGTSMTTKELNSPNSSVSTSTPARSYTSLAHSVQAMQVDEERDFHANSLYKKHSKS